MEIPEKKIIGRPTKYEPALGLIVLEEMEKGMSLVAACSAINIGRTTVYEWIERYPEFGTLVELGKAARLAFLERRLINGEVTGPQATTAIFALKNASADWREDQKSSVEVSGPGGAPLFQAITFSVIDSKDMKVIEHEADDE